MAPQHPPRFLKIVDDAKTRVRETNVDEVKARMNRGDKFVLVDVRRSELLRIIFRARFMGRSHQARRQAESARSEHAFVVLRRRIPMGAGGRQPQKWDIPMISMDGGIRGGKASATQG
jgi:hypothetical protein